MKTKRFNLSDILSVSTGRLVSDRHIDGVYDLMGHITADNGITTIGLMAMADSCKTFLLSAFPELAKADTSTLDARFNSLKDRSKESLTRVCQEWIAEVATVVGKTEFDVPQMTVNRPRDLADDLQTLHEVGFKGKVIGVVMPEKN